MVIQKFSKEMDESTLAVRMQRTKHENDKKNQDIAMKAIMDQERKI